MQENYQILGVSENASKEEITSAYLKLKEKYSRERFYEGEIGNEAARRLTKIETAYSEIMRDFDEQNNSQGQNNGYAGVEKALKDGKLDEAQALLDNVTNRDAEWHYLQSVIFYKKNWFNESIKQLEIAMELDPGNRKYGDAYTKLKEKMDYTAQQFRSGNANFDGNANGDPNRQMGGDGANDCLRFCATWCCIDMFCNFCCR